MSSPALSTDTGSPQLSSVPSPQQAAPAGFFVRFLANVIDLLLLLMVQFPVSFAFTLVRGGTGVATLDPTQLQQALQQQQQGAMFWMSMGLEWACTTLIGVAYFGWFYSKRGATPGKMLFGIRVLDGRTGAHLGFWRAAFRETFCKAISAVLLMVGYLMAAFRKDRRALHDLMVGSQVVRRRK
jgi:uncharacterized RDD family membrane protein YckC